MCDCTSTLGGVSLGDTLVGGRTPSRNVLLQSKNNYSVIDMEGVLRNCAPFVSSGDLTFAALAVKNYFSYD